MQRIFQLVAGMLAVVALAAGCGPSSSDSAMPTAQASQAAGAPGSASASAVTGSAAAPTSSAATSGTGASSGSASPASSSSTSSSSGSDTAPAVAAALDLGAINFDPDVPTWPTSSCQNGAQGGPEDGEGAGYPCLYIAEPESFEYFGVGFQYVQGDSGPYHAMYICGCNQGGADLGVAQGGTVSEALDWYGSLIVGFGDAADGVTHALYWPNGPGSATILPLPVGVDPHTHSEAHAVNSAGEIVGTYWVASDPQNVGTRAVLWEPDASAPDGSGYLAYDLTSLLPASASGVILAAAYGIDCTGDVAADGAPADSQGSQYSAALNQHRYLLTRNGGNGATCSS